jgi:hypothetical protein
LYRVSVIGQNDAHVIVQKCISLGASPPILAAYTTNCTEVLTFYTEWQNRFQKKLPSPLQGISLLHPFTFPMRCEPPKCERNNERVYKCEQRC